MKKETTEILRDDKATKARRTSNASEETKTSELPQAEEKKRNTFLSKLIVCISKFEVFSKNKKLIVLIFIVSTLALFVAWYYQNIKIYPLLQLTVTAVLFIISGLSFKQILRLIVKPKLKEFKDVYKSYHTLPPQEQSALKAKIMDIAVNKENIGPLYEAIQIMIKHANGTLKPKHYAERILGLLIDWEYISVPDKDIVGVWGELVGKDIKLNTHYVSTPDYHRGNGTKTKKDITKIERMLSGVGIVPIGSSKRR